MSGLDDDSIEAILERAEAWARRNPVCRGNASRAARDREILLERLRAATDVHPSQDFAIVRGLRYPVVYAGVDRATYQHLDGCLYKADARMPCQCGALERAAKIYTVTVPPTKEG